MRIFYYAVLVILILLAASSGVSKVMLMQQDVDFFGQYGFTNPVLIVFGIVQLLGGVLLAISKTRVVGAIIVAMTFLISAAILAMANNVPMAIVTLICALLLGFVIRQSFKNAS